MPTKTQLLNGINLACKHFMRSASPNLVPNSITGTIEEDWSIIAPAQTLGDAPIVCIVPTTGIINKGPAVKDKKGITYTPVRLPSGLSAYKYFQPNNSYYATILDYRLIHNRNSSPKTTTGWVRVKFIDKDQPSNRQDIMEIEVRKITRWGPPLSAPEFEYQVKMNSCGLGFTNARAVFLPDRLIESTSWTTIWKSGSSEDDLGPDSSQRAAAVPGLSPFTMLISRVGAMISSIPGLASRAVGINKFYERNNVTFELFEGLGGYFDNFNNDPHHIHSDAMFRPGEKTQTERPRYGWWWWPTRTGTPLSRRLYTGQHFPWSPNARSIEALYYLFKYADAVPSDTDSDEDGMRHCYEWLKDMDFDGWGVSRTYIAGSPGDIDQWGQHTAFAGSAQTAYPYNNWSKHWIGLRGYHTAYWADHLLRFAIACGWLYPALRRQGDTTRANEVKRWLMKATDVLLGLQLPWNGVFVDDEGNENCQVDVAGGLPAPYRILNGVPRACRYSNRLEELASIAGAAIPNAQRQQGLIPNAHPSHYELSIGVILAFALAYHAVDDGQGPAIAVNWPPVADAGNDQTVAPGATVTLDASWSTSPSGRTLTYSWRQTSGVSVTLSSSTAVNPVFTAPAAVGKLVFEVTVSDGVTTSKDTVTVEVRKPVPATPANLVATSGNAQIALSWDNPNDSSITRYEYRWRSGSAPFGNWSTIANSDAVTVGWTRTSLTNTIAYGFQLRAVNSNGAGADAEIGPVRPSAIPTLSLNEQVGFDPYGEDVGLWCEMGDFDAEPFDLEDIDTSGSNKRWSGDEIPDTSGSGAHHWWNAYIPNTATPGNIRFVARGGPDIDPQFVAGRQWGFRVYVKRGVDNDWRYVAGGSDVLAAASFTSDGKTIVEADFTVPLTNGAGDWPEWFNSARTSLFDVKIEGTPINRPPVAVATASPSTVASGASVTLDGSGSSDPDGDTLSYIWEQLTPGDGDHVTLSGANTETARFTAPPGTPTLTFKLTVTDSRGASDTDNVVIAVEAPND